MSDDDGFRPPKLRRAAAVPSAVASAALSAAVASASGSPAASPPKPHNTTPLLPQREKTLSVEETAHSGGRARLLSLHPENVGHIVVPAAAEVFRIGRADRCDLVLKNNPFISNVHCTLKFTPEGVTITDTSTNGTIVAGTRLAKGTETPVATGAEIIVATGCTQPKHRVAFVLHVGATEDAAAAAAAPKRAASVASELAATSDGPPSKRSASGGHSASAMESAPEHEPAALDDPVSRDPGDHATSSDEPGVAGGAGGAAAAAGGTAAAAPAPDDGETEARMGDDDLAANLVCPICQEIFHDCVSVMPCLHNFCGGCYSMWMANSSTCPDCRATVNTVRRNHTLRNLVNSFLATHPERRRPADELADLDMVNKITTDSVLPSAHRASDDDESDEYDSEMSGSDRGGGRAFHSMSTRFSAATAARALPDTAGVGSAAGGAAAAAAGPGVAVDAPISISSTQSSPASPGGAAAAAPASALAPVAAHSPPGCCVFCNGHFCNTTWRSGCRPCRWHELGGCYLPLSDLTLVDSDCNNVVQRNAFESGILQEYLAANGKTFSSMFSECVAEMVAGTMHTPGGMPRPETYYTCACRDCALKLFATGALEYRKRIAPADLPASAKVKTDGTPRTDCWYGYGCRTQFSRPHHAANFNHICEARPR